MFSIPNLISIVLIVFGLLFLFFGVIGLFRFPDFFTRMHAAGKCDTLGSLLVVSGLAVYSGFTLGSLKIVFIAVFTLAIVVFAVIVTLFIIVRVAASLKHGILRRLRLVRVCSGSAR